MRNFRLGWTVPYVAQGSGAWRRYEPDFAVRFVQSGDGPPLQIMIECKGVVDEDAMRKNKYVRNWWLPAVNDGGEDWGLWEYCVLEQAGHTDAVLQSALGNLEAKQREKPHG